MFKNVFVSEDFLQILPPNLAFTLVHFRTPNHGLPIQRGRIQNIPFDERICTEHNSEDIGDEFHIFFSVVSLPNLDKKFFRNFIIETQMLINSKVSYAVKRNVS